LEGANYSDQDFKTKFAFAFDLLVDADFGAPKFAFSKLSDLVPGIRLAMFLAPADPKATGS
jgi:hypothetical protein